MAAVGFYSVLIRETHVDMIGHVNNATYLTLYEEARWDLITSNGYGLPEIQRMQQGPVILEVTVKYLRELRLRETISITTEVLGYSGKIGKLKQTMTKADGSIASEAIFTFGLLDMKERKLIAPTAAWIKATETPT